MNENDKDIDRLIDRFASGDISDEEQRQLISRLNAEDTSDIPEGLEGRLSDTIDRLAESDRTRSDIRVSRHRNSRFRLILSAAASLAVIISLGVHFFTTPSSDVPPSTLSPPPKRRTRKWKKPCSSSPRPSAKACSKSRWSRPRLPTSPPRCHHKSTIPYSTTTVKFRQL